MNKAHKVQAGVFIRGSYKRHATLITQVVV